jgi:hypothetical protein
MMILFLEEVYAQYHDRNTIKIVLGAKSQIKSGKITYPKRRYYLVST